LISPFLLALKRLIHFLFLLPEANASLLAGEKGFGLILSSGLRIGISCVECIKSFSFCIYCLCQDFAFFKIKSYILLKIRDRGKTEKNGFEISCVSVEK